MEESQGDCRASELLVEALSQRLREGEARCEELRQEVGGQFYFFHCP